MLVEFLTFRVPRHQRAQWLAVEQVTWSRFLVRQHGFVDKQLWVEQGNDDEIHAVIRWTDEQSWKQIPQDDLDRVDEAMGAYRRTPRARVYEVLAEVQRTDADG
jgi:uncharacterized protein (TIGR03792 family)